MSKRQNESSSGKEKIGELEKIYSEFLVPMSPAQWSCVRNLSQPSLLKKVPLKTAYSSFAE